MHVGTSNAKNLKNKIFGKIWPKNLKFHYLELENLNFGNILAGTTDMYAFNNQYWELCELSYIKFWLYDVFLTYNLTERLFWKTDLSVNEHTTQENKIDLSSKNLSQLYIMPGHFNEKWISGFKKIEMQHFSICLCFIWVWLLKYILLPFVVCIFIMIFYPLHFLPYCTQ